MKRKIALVAAALLLIAALTLVTGCGEPMLDNYSSDTFELG